MTLHIGFWILPLVLSLACVAAMFRPWRSTGDWDYSFVIRVFWFFPILAVWLIYFAVAYYLK